MAENIYFLSGDVGGTKARLHMYQLKDDGSILAVANEVNNIEYSVSVFI